MRNNRKYTAAERIKTMNRSRIKDRGIKRGLMLVLIASVMMLTYIPAFAETSADAAGDVIVNNWTDIGEESEAGETGNVDMAPNCKSAILYEATTGTVLFSKNADVPLAPASMTKVMTAILVLENNPNLEGTLTVDERAVSHYYCSSMEPQRHLIEGEEISFMECMKYLLIPSGNEAATAFAFNLAGDMSKFVELMNEKAVELGCVDTHFSDPTGITGNNHYTTASDMVKICEYAMSFDKFRECVSFSEGSVPPSNVREKGFNYETTNRVKFPDDRYESEYSKYVTGVKTGWTPAAGYCFSGCMEKDGLVFYSVAMGGDELDNGDGRILQGDFIDTINMYSLTDGLTADNFADYYPQQASTIWIIAGIAVIALIAIMMFMLRKNRIKG